MGEIIGKEKKTFKSPSDYRNSFFYYGFLFVIACVSEFAAFYWTEDNINEYINDNSGNSEDKLAKSILRIVVKFWGKPGFIVATSCVCVMILYEIYKGIAEYRRYKKKLRLLHEGVIKNVYDIYDDYERQPLWKRIMKLFSKKTKNGNKGYY